ncbi:hypothetical protein CLORY_32950 [Clostridium oryzae]|uniref:Transposase IS200 like protein n=1 Tax=Clostridium oryzae TaxID=1450648 RepID=A0A1V4IHM2_9CLOT|nr:hypothetical protein CLORY_32950 [Clostridium oryzae]
MKDTNSLSHTTWNCKYHIVFAPKYRSRSIVWITYIFLRLWNILTLRGYDTLKKKLLSIFFLLTLIFVKFTTIVLAEPMTCEEKLNSLEPQNLKIIYYGIPTT